MATKRIETSYTITWSSPNIVVTYASTYATFSVTGTQLVISAVPGSDTNLLLGDASSKVTLDWRKETSLSAVSRSSLISAVQALVVPVNTFAAGINTDDVTAITGTLVTVNDDLDVVSTLTVDTINESTTAAGVTIDGVLVKDNAITAPGALRGASLTFDGTNIISDFTDRTTWTPSFSLSTNLTGTPTYANSYIARIGPLVFLETTIAGLSTSGSGLSAGIMTLPIAMPTALGLCHATGTVYGVSLTPVRAPLHGIRNSSSNTTQMYVWFNATAASTVTPVFLAVYFAA